MLEEEGQEDNSTKKVGYFSIKRIIMLIIWSLTMVCFPQVAVSLEILPAGLEFIPLMLIGVLIFVILFNKESFRVGVCFAVILAGFTLYQPDFLRQLIDGLNNRMQDAFYVLRGPKKPTNQVVIVDIDQKSLETVGLWPWPRSDSGKIIRNLFADGARVIGYDIVFAEPGRFSIQDWVQRLNAMGIQMQFPGLTVEETKEQLENGDWQFNVPGPLIRRAVFNYWQDKFEGADANFFVMADEGPKREQELIEKYLDVDKGQWYQDHTRYAEEYKSIGKTYKIPDYQAPENVVLQMAKEASELFYLDSTWRNSKDLIEGVSVILDNDESFGNAIGETPVVSGGLFILGGRSGSTELHKDPEVSEGMVVTSPVWNVEDIFPGLRKGDQQVLNIPEIQAQTNFQGMFNIVPDKSGAARFYTMFLRAPVFEEGLIPKDGVELKGAAALNSDNYEVKIISTAHTYPAISFQMLRVANGYNQAEAVVQNGQRGVILRRDEYSKFGTDSVFEMMGMEKRPFKHLLPKEKFIPLDFKGDLRINFLGYGGRWHLDAPFAADYFMPYISISDVLHNRFPPGTFKDKYVLIGSTDPTLSDLVGSPFRPAFPGLEVHATMLENLISEDYLIDLGNLGLLYNFIGILIGGTILSALIAYTGPWVAAVFMMGILTFLPGISYVGFAHWGVIIEFIYPWLCTAFIGIVVILINFFIEGKEKRFLQATFKSYLSPELIDMMVESGNMPSLGGSENVLTAYFTDIASFSTFSEALGSPTKLVELLNEYLTAMTDILLENNGTLDKYEGDAIIAFYGAPMPLANHAYSSCISALQMQDTLDGLRKKWEEEGDKWPELVWNMRMRIGINTGPIVTGNMGSATRMNYTMMGDTVNLAARLESGAKQYGVFTMCSKETIQSAEEGDTESMLYRVIDAIRVVGKTEPVITYEILHISKKKAPEELKRCVEIFMDARELYLAMQWDEAKKTFEECLDYEPHHPDRAGGCKTTPSHVFIQRCIDYKKNPPTLEGEEWDGVYTATSK